MRKLSRGMSSSRRRRASARPSSTMRLPYSVRLTTPLMISPTRSLNSSYCFLRSYSRTRWTMTCLAVWAGMRPKSMGGRGSTRWLANLDVGLELAGDMERGSGSRRSRRFPPTSVQRVRRTSPLLAGRWWRECPSRWPYLARPAFWMACSMASRTLLRVRWTSHGPRSRRRGGVRGGKRRCPSKSLSQFVSEWPAVVAPWLRSGHR